MSIGKTMLGRRHVIPSVTTSLTELMVEGTFPMGTYLVTVHNPISSDDGDLEKALYGSFLPIPSKDLFPLPDPAEYEAKKMPGAVVTVEEGNITMREGRKRIRLKVSSRGDRPIQVSYGPHFGPQKHPLTIARSAPTTTLLKPTPSSSLTDSNRTATFSTLPPAPRSASSLAIPRPSLLWKLVGTAPSKAAIVWRPA